MNLYYFKVNNEYVSVWHETSYEAYCQVKRYFNNSASIKRLEHRSIGVIIDYLY